MMAAKQELQTVVQGNGLFTKSIYNVLSKTPGNVFFSPISIHAVLSMTYQGSSGSTLEAFSNVLKLPDIETAANGYKEVMAHLNNIPDIQLLMANKIYFMANKTLQQKFKDIVEGHFLAEVQPINFGNGKESALEINDWVENKTNHKIKDVIQEDDVNEDTRLVLINAIYFKGNWERKFDEKLTKPDKFYLDDVNSIEVPMMFNNGRYLYKEDETLDSKVLEMPYSNPNVSLVIILPNQRDGIHELEKKLVDTDLTQITNGMSRVEVNVKLPKFKIEQTIQLNGVLKEVGLDIIFDKFKAEFPNMLVEKEQLFVTKVVQKAFIEVNEEGTEAAAATGMRMYMLCANIYEESPKEFYADHPFIILLNNCIRVIDRKLQAQIPVKTQMFVGRILNPKK